MHGAAPTAAPRAGGKQSIWRGTGVACASTYHVVGRAVPHRSGAWRASLGARTVLRKKGNRRFAAQKERVAGAGAGARVFDLIF